MISYKPEVKTIELSGEISSYGFFSEMFIALREYYSQEGIGVPPIISIIGVDRFDPLVLPNLFGIGILLKNIHNIKTQFKFARVSSTKYLESTKFFDNVGEEKEIGEEFSVDGNRILKTKKIGCSLFDFDKNELGFYNNQHDLSSYNTEHKLQVFNDSSYEYYKNYNEITDKYKLDLILDTIRTEKFNVLKPLVEKYFFNILYKNNHTQYQITEILQILTEVICNSILYSGSLCAAMLQTRENKTTISISDFGVGFEYSFKQKPNFKYSVTDAYLGENKEDLSKYLLIFDALEYSKNKKRENLYTLLEIVINGGGKMRIHYDNVQVIFTSNRCRKCQTIEPVKCSTCLLNSMSHDKLISPVRFFDSKFQGVHIEVELNY